MVACEFCVAKSDAAFGGAPHQSSIGSEEPMDDSFSLWGEALSHIRHFQFYRSRIGLLPKASPSREKLSEKVPQSTFSD